MWSAQPCVDATLDLQWKTGIKRGDNPLPLSIEDKKFPRDWVDKYP